MADTRVSQLPTYTGTITTTDPGYFLYIDNTTTPGTPISKKILLSQLPWGSGGGGTLTGTSRWTTAGSPSKNAYTAPSVVNNDGITIALVASSGTGAPTSCRVSLNGVTLTPTYTPTGTFPNYVLTVPVGDLTGNVAETIASVTVGVVGTFSGSSFNISAGTLTNVQPVPFTTTLSASYAATSLPFYIITTNVNYSYSNAGAITAFNGTLTPGGAANAASGSFSNIAITGVTIGGTATGNGLYGAGSSTVTLSGSVPAVPTYIPAFYQQTANSTLPTWTIGTSQTTGSAIGSTITYPSATATTQYNWVCTQRPIGNISVSTLFGPVPFVADATGTTTLGGQTFNVFGITNLGVGTAMVITIS